MADVFACAFDGEAPHPEQVVDELDGLDVVGTEEAVALAVLPEVEHVEFRGPVAQDGDLQLEHGGHLADGIVLPGAEDLVGGQFHRGRHPRGLPGGPSCPAGGGRRRCLRHRFGVGRARGSIVGRWQQHLFGFPEPGVGRRGGGRNARRSGIGDRSGGRCSSSLLWPVVIREQFELPELHASILRKTGGLPGASCPHVDTRVSRTTGCWRPPA